MGTDESGIVFRKSFRFHFLSEKPLRKRGRFLPASAHAEYDGAAVRLYNRIFKLRNIVGLVGCKSLRALLHALGEKRLHALRRTAR